MRDLSDESAPTSLGEGNCVHGSYVQLGMTTVVQSLERGSDTEVGTVCVISSTESPLS